MKRRFTEEQKAFALRQADSGVPMSEILRKLGISEATFYRWKKKYGGLGVARPTVTHRNDAWSMDFVSDQLYDGRRIRALTLVDNHTRESLAIHVAQRVRSVDVIGVLEGMAGEHGLPGSIRVDNGPEFTSRELDCWAYWNRVTLDFSRPGKRLARDVNSYPAIFGVWTLDRPGGDWGIEVHLVCQAVRSTKHATIA